MGQGVVKYDIGGHFRREIGGIGAEHILILPLAGADDNQLEVIPHQVVHDGLHQVHPLVAHQAGDHNHHGHIPDGQTQPLLEELLVFRLLLQGGGVEVGVDQGVASGIEHIRVDAVDHAAELVGVLAQYVVEAVGIVRVLDLERVGAGHGAHPVGGMDGCLHQVGAGVEVHGGLPVLGQAQNLVHELVGEPALILHVVDGEQGADGLVFGHIHIVGPEKHGDHGGLPVVGMDHIGIPIQILEGLQNGLGVEGEALTVVVVAVAAVPVEVVLVVDEVILELLALAHRPEQPSVHVAPGQGHGEVGDILNLKLRVVLDGLVIGQKDVDFGIRSLGQGLGQGGGHIAQAAGFNKRRGLAGGK